MFFPMFQIFPEERNGFSPYHSKFRKFCMSSCNAAVSGWHHAGCWSWWVLNCPQCAYEISTGSSIGLLSLRPIGAAFAHWQIVLCMLVCRPVWVQWACMGTYVFHLLLIWLFSTLLCLCLCPRQICGSNNSLFLSICCFCTCYWKWNINTINIE